MRHTGYRGGWPTALAGLAAWMGMGTEAASQQAFRWAGEAFSVPSHVQPLERAGRLSLRADGELGTRIMRVGPSYLYLGPDAEVTLDAGGYVAAQSGRALTLTHRLRLGSGEFGANRSGNAASARELLDDIVNPTEIGNRRLGWLAPNPGAGWTMGGATVLPWTEVEMKFDTNSHLDPSSSTDTWWSQTNVGLLGHYSLFDGALELLGGGTSQVTSFEHPTLDGKNQHLGLASFRFDGGSFYARGGWRYENRHKAVRIDHPFDGHHPIETVDSTLGLNLGDSWFIEAGGASSTTDGFGSGGATYPGSRMNMDASSMRLRAGIRTSEDSSTWLEWASGERDMLSAAMNNADTDRISIGTQTGRLGRWQIRGSAGMQWEDYESGAVLDDGTTGTLTDTAADESDLVYDLGAVWFYGPTNKAEVRLLRAFAPHHSANFQLIDRAEVFLTRALSAAVVAKAGIFSESGAVSAGSTDGVDANRWGIGAGFRWNIWSNLDVSSDWEYRNRDQDGGSTGDYDDHRFIFGLAVRL